MREEADPFIGQRFGKWEVVAFSHKDKYNHGKYLCRCDCGTEKVLFASDLRRGSTRSCGCAKAEVLSKANIKNLVGQRFGRLVVETLSHVDNGAHWSCICDCGCRKTIRSAELQNGNTISCGCFAKEAVAARNTTHGLSKHPLYKTWRAMCARCRDENLPHYKYYGARGIRVCDRWNGRGGFPNFLEDMGEKPGEEYTLDRINNDGNYEPVNCRWATVDEQLSNTSRNRYLTLDGVRMTCEEWADKLGMSSDTLNNRLNTLGWSVERALTTPVMRKYSNYK